MDRRDGRTLNRKALEDIRIQAVRQVEAGESPEMVIKALGFTRGRIYGKCRTNPVLKATCFFPNFFERSRGEGPQNRQL